MRGFLVPGRVRGYGVVTMVLEMGWADCGEWHLRGKRVSLGRARCNMECNGVRGLQPVVVVVVVVDCGLWYGSLPRSAKYPVRAYRLV